MNTRDFITFLNKIEKLKCNTRHSWTSNSRQESVAEHCWRVAVMALLCEEEYPDIDMNKVVKMCLIHDLGEAVLGDIPAFIKTESDETAEEKAVDNLVSELPASTYSEWKALFAEMKELSTPEAKLCKSLDKLETLVSHNEADISTWLPIEYTENLVYGQKEVLWSPYMSALKDEIKKDALEKIGRESPKNS